MAHRPIEWPQFSPVAQFWTARATTTKKLYNTAPPTQQKQDLDQIVPAAAT